MQQVLDTAAGARLAVYAVWFERFEGDSREGWPAGLLTDTRVLHLWDAEQAVGTRYGTLTRPGADWIEWDAWFLYPAGPRWGAAPLDWGRTIVASEARLRRRLPEALSAPPP